MEVSELSFGHSRVNGRTRTPSPVVAGYVVLPRDDARLCWEGTDTPMGWGRYRESFGLGDASELREGEQGLPGRA